MDNYISVIICTYNRCESLKETLDSLLTQEYDGSFGWEVLVVDNNSKDNTKQVVELYRSRFDGKLRYLFEPRQRQSLALNRGIKEARGEIIAFTDDDCIVEKNWVLKINKLFSNYKVDLIQGKVLPLIKAIPPSWFDAKTWSRINSYYDQYEAVFLRKFPKELSLDGANFAITKKSILLIGDFNPLIVRAHDTDYGLRAVKAGIEIYYSPEIKVHHKIDSRQFSKKFWRRTMWIVGKQYIEYADIDGNGDKNCIFGIPRWLYRDFIEALAKYIFFTFLFNPRKSFKYEKIVIYRVGMIYSFYSRSKRSHHRK